jgi:K+-transporting ATPase ATPase C chain
MRTAVRAALMLMVVLLVTGVAYPLVITAIAQGVFGDRADGSLVRVDGRVIGSTSIGQSWGGEGWFHGRPSAVGYDATTSGGSNLGPTSRNLADDVERRVRAILELEEPFVSGLRPEDVPADLVTASASGLDPHISVSAAELQAPRIAAVNGLSLEQVEQLIDEHTEPPTLGFLGQERVNVLQLNLALASIDPSSLGGVR